MNLLNYGCMSYSSGVPPVYKFNFDNGNTYDDLNQIYFDCSSYGNDGSPKLGSGAIQFNSGGKEYSNIGTYFGYNASASISFWVKPTQDISSYGNNEIPILWYSQYNAINGGFGLNYIYDGSYYLKYYYYDYNNYNTTYYYTLPVNDWTHIVLDFGYVNYQYTSNLYVNGSLINTIYGGNQLQYANQFTLLDDSIYLFPFSFDALYIYNYIIGQDKVTWLYNNGSGNIE